MFFPQNLIEQVIAEAGVDGGRALASTGVNAKAEIVAQPNVWNTTVPGQPSTFEVNLGELSANGDFDIGGTGARAGGETATYVARVKASTTANFPGVLCCNLGRSV